jgi:ribosomal protein S18 acetylase RimI-like enzyme
MKINRTILIRCLWILSGAILVVLCFDIVRFFSLGEEAGVGVFGLAATLVGTIFIAIELRNSQEVTCCEMLIDQNNYFHDNDHLMKVYKALERSQAEGDIPSVWEEVEEVDIACYCTFFENLYLLYSHKIARIEDLDDLFGYRFFIFVNNPHIQEKHILPTSSSYNEIFRLYEAWQKYRKKNGCHIPGAENAFSEAYLKDRLYLHDRGPASRTDVTEFDEGREHFSIRRLGFEAIPEILAVQQRACDAMPDKSLFFPLSREELVESMHMDTVLGAFSEDGQLAGFALFVNNRQTPRNLSADAGLPWDKTYTFDVVVSDPAWRGYGLQRAFIDCSLEEARKGGADTILATVSPSNKYSLDNFMQKGFTVIKSGMSKYGGLDRSLLACKV